MCPYCYIGKKKNRRALAQFPHAANVEIEWKSFQLDASFVASDDDNMVEHLAEKYRKENWAQEMMDSMTQNAKKFRIPFRESLWQFIQCTSTLHLAKNTQVK
jgi:protein disulfide-isomerase